MLSSASQSFCEDRDLCYIPFPSEEDECWKEEVTHLSIPKGRERLRIKIFSLQSLHFKNYIVLFGMF